MHLYIKCLLNWYTEWEFNNGLESCWETSVCVWVGWMPMEYISSLEDGCYLHEKEWNCGLFLVNHLASGCATLQLVAGKEVSLTITSK